MIPALSTAGLSATVARWSCLVLAGVAVFLAGYSHGRHVVEGEKAQAERDIALAYAGEIVARQGIADGLTAENATLRAVQAPKDRIITREITRYETVTKPAQRCLLPGTWRLRHDAAATGDPAALAEARPLVAGEDAPVEDAAAIQTVGDNYQICRDAIAKLAGWQRRYAAIDEHDR